MKKMLMLAMYSVLTAGAAGYSQVAVSPGVTAGVGLFEQTCASG